MARSGVRASLLLVAGVGATLWLGTGQVSAQSGEQTGDASNSNSQAVTIQGEGGSVTVNNSSSSTAASGDEAAVSVETSNSVSVGENAGTDAKEPAAQNETEEGTQPRQTVDKAANKETGGSGLVTTQAEERVAGSASMLPPGTQQMRQRFRPAYAVSASPAQSQPAAQVSGEAPSEPPVPGDGLDRYTSWLNQSLLPGGNPHGSPAANTALTGGVAAFLIILSLAGLAAGFGGYVAQLHRSGFQHGARSDASGIFNFLTPTKVGLVWAFSPAQSPPFSGGLTLSRKGGEWT